VRYLHRLFHDQGTSVARWVRERRLANCRRDLEDPALAQRGVQAIARRWGFEDPAHFSKIFKASYGDPPSAPTPPPALNRPSRCNRHAVLALVRHVLGEITTWICQKLYANSRIVLPVIFFRCSLGSRHQGSAAGPAASTQGSPNRTEAIFFIGLVMVVTILVALMLSRR
jgi:hypothetical protein